MDKILLVAVVFNLLFVSPVLAEEKLRIYDEKSRFVGYITESGRIYDKDSRFRGTIQGDRIYDEKSRFKGTIKKERSGGKVKIPCRK
jgi:hypothetical protein